jgi:phosphoribosylglycinamide formyltransferase-1
MPIKRLNIAILASGNGTAIKLLPRAIAEKNILATIKVIITDIATAPVINFGKDHNIITHVIPKNDWSRQDHEKLIANQLASYDIDYIFLAGYMRILSAEFVASWPHKIINIHPSLLPAFAGLQDLQLHSQVLASGQKVSGCTVHYVTAVVDSGPIIIQKRCAVAQNDTVLTLKSKVQALEQQAYIEVLQRLTNKEQN